MEQRIALPASVLRRIAEGTYKGQKRQELAGRVLNAQSIADARYNVYDELGDTKAHFVGVKASDLSTLMAFADTADPEAKAVGRSELKRTGFWS